MGESKSEIKKYLSTMLIMDEYLFYVGYDGIYTQLDGREDQFLSLAKWLENLYGETSKKAFDGYKDDDVDDLRDIAFDFIRIRNEYDGKEFRNLAEGQKENHFFGDKKIWQEFSKGHFELLDSLVEEPEIDYNSKNLEKHLNERDKIFFESSKINSDKSEFIENLKYNKTQVEYNRAGNAPEKLVKKASQAFAAIKTGHKSFANPEVQNLVKELGDQVLKSLQEKSPARVLNHIINLFESIEVEKIPDNELEEVKKQTKKIQQIGYQINKSL
jgi:hypothetical protein